MKEPFVKFIETKVNALGDEGWELVTATVEKHKGLLRFARNDEMKLNYLF